MNAKKLIICFTVFVLLLSCAAGACAAAETEIVPDTSWYSTYEDTLTINTAEELAGLAAIVNGTALGINADSFKGKTILLGSDIVLNSTMKVKSNAYVLKEWISAGNMFDGTVFSGTFDGQNHTISGLYSTTNGLFGCMDHATVKNLTITNSQVKTSDIVPGIIAGFASEDVTFENCHVKDSTIESTSVTTGDVGAIAGEIGSGKVIGCTVTNTNVFCCNSDYTGGMVGYIDGVAEFTDCAVSDCYIMGAKSGVGGIAGYAFTDVTFNNCSVKACFIESVYNNFAGGIVGYGGAEVNISGCSVSGSEIAGYKHSVGGIVGYSYHTNFLNSPTSVEDSAIASETEEYVGGLVGASNRDVTISIDGCTIDKCYIACCLGAVTSNIGPVIGRGSVAEGSIPVTVTNTILSNKNYPKQSDKNTFNAAGITDSNGWIVSQKFRETVNGVLFGMTEKNFLEQIPNFESDLNTRISPYEQASSPLPLLGILAGLGAAALFALRRH